MDNDSRTQKAGGQALENQALLATIPRTHRSDRNSSIRYEGPLRRDCQRNPGDPHEGRIARPISQTCDKVDRYARHRSRKDPPAPSCSHEVRRVGWDRETGSQAGSQPCHTPGEGHRERHLLSGACVSSPVQHPVHLSDRDTRKPLGHCEVWREHEGHLEDSCAVVFLCHIS